MATIREVSMGLVAWWVGRLVGRADFHYVSSSLFSAGGTFKFFAVAETRRVFFLFLA
jgi:hypothetical protein